MIDYNNPGFLLEKNMPVTTFWEYLEKKAGRTITEDEHEDFIDKHHEKSKFIKAIISLQVSLFILRRTNCVCGSNIDTLKSLLMEKYRSYYKTFGEEFVDFNKDVNF